MVDNFGGMGSEAVVPGMVPATGVDGIRPGVAGQPAPEVQPQSPNENVPAALDGTNLTPEGAGPIQPETPLPVTPPPAETATPVIEPAGLTELPPKPPAGGGDVLGSVETGLNAGAQPAIESQPPHRAEPGELEAMINPPDEPPASPEESVNPTEGAGIDASANQPETAPGTVETGKPDEVLTATLDGLKSLRDGQAQALEATDRLIAQIETKTASNQQG